MGYLVNLDQVCSVVGETGDLDGAIVGLPTDVV